MNVELVPGIQIHVIHVTLTFSILTSPVMLLVPLMGTLLTLLHGNVLYVIKDVSEWN